MPDGARHPRRRRRPSSNQSIRLIARRNAIESRDIRRRRRSSCRRRASDRVIASGRRAGWHRPPAAPVASRRRTVLGIGARSRRSSRRRDGRASVSRRCSARASTYRSATSEWPGHLRRLRQPHQREQRRRDVLQRAAVGASSPAARRRRTGTTVQRVRGVRLAGRGVVHRLGVAVVGGDQHLAAGVARRRDDAADARVERLDRALDGGVEVAGVADHVAVGVVADDRVVAAAARSPRPACR